MPPYCEKHQTHHEMAYVDFLPFKTCVCIQCQNEKDSVFNPLPQAIKTTELPSKAAAVEGLILTEEELKEIDEKMLERNFKDYVTDFAYMDFKKVVESHRELLAANAELSFKNPVAKAKVKEYYLGLKSNVGKSGLTEMDVYHATQAIENVLHAFKIKIEDVNA